MLSSPRPGLRSGSNDLDSPRAGSRPKSGQSGRSQQARCSLQQDLQTPPNITVRFMKRFRFVSAVFLGCAVLVCSALATDILTDRGDNARTGLDAEV
jgi:hypothetical protein